MYMHRSKEILMSILIKLTLLGKRNQKQAILVFIDALVLESSIVFSNIV